MNVELVANFFISLGVTGSVLLVCIGVATDNLETTIIGCVCLVVSLTALGTRRW